MRKLDKSCNLSLVYKQEEEHWESNNLPHPVYNSSDYKYYMDIKMQLLHCQNGLCAYTEKRLCFNETLYSSDLWENGRYTGKDIDKEIEGNLEHFDSELKKDKAWLWDNFFWIKNNTNLHKSTKKVDARLKPDHPDYTPSKWFDYDDETHRFVPNPSLGKADTEAAKNAIECLGLNSCKSERRTKISNYLEDIQLERKPQKLEEFLTALNFCLQKLQTDKK